MDYFQVLLFLLIMKGTSIKNSIKFAYDIVPVKKGFSTHKCYVKTAYLAVVQ